MSKECIGYNDITKQFIYRDEETGFSLNARFDMKPEETKVNIWGYELCNGAEWKDFLDVVNKLGKEKTDLESRLANCIEPKFKIGQEVWFIDSRVNDFNEQRYIIQSFKIEAIRFDNFDFEYQDCWGDTLVQNDLFATKEEAIRKLEEMGNE